MKAQFTTFKTNQLCLGVGIECLIHGEGKAVAPTSKSWLHHLQLNESIKNATIMNGIFSSTSWNVVVLERKRSNLAYKLPTATFAFEKDKKLFKNCFVAGFFDLIMPTSDQATQLDPQIRKQFAIITFSNLFNQYHHSSNPYITMGD